MPIYAVPEVNWSEPLTDRNGRVTPYFQRYLSSSNQRAGQGAQAAADYGPAITTLNGQVSALSLNKVSKNTSTGWTAATGTADKTTFATYTAPAITNPPTQAEVQAIADHLQVLSRHLKALIDAGLTSELLDT